MPDVHRLREAAGPLELSLADLGSHGRAGFDFAEEERSREIVGQPQSMVDELCHRVARGHLPLYAVESESGSGERNQQRHLPAQHLGAEQQQQNEGDKRSRTRIRPLGEELVAKNAAPSLTDQISHSHSSCVWVPFREATRSRNPKLPQSYHYP